MFPKADPAYFTQSSLSTIIKEEKTASSTMGKHSIEQSFDFHFNFSKREYQTEKILLS